MTQFLYENYEARQYKEKLRQEKMSKMIGYLMKYNIKINDSIKDTDLEALYLLYLSMDPDFLSSDLIEAERDSRFGAVCNAIVSLLKNTADALSIPSISKIIKTVGSTAIGHALTAGRIATSTANDIFQDLDKRRDKGEVLRKLDEEDSVFRIYSSFMEYYEKLSEDYKKIYPSFARQFAMFGAMNQRPEDANLSRLFVKQFTYQLGTIFESEEYEFLPFRYGNIKDEMWWLNKEYLNKSYKLSKQFIPGMMGLGTSFISGIPDINAFSFFSNLAEYGNVDVDELRNYYDSKKIPAVKTISISPGNSKKSKYDDKKSYDDSNKSIDFSNLESPFEIFNFSSDYFSDSIDSFQKLITEAGYFDDENYTTSLLPENYGMADDIMSSLNVPVDVSSLLGESNTFNLTESMLLPSSAGQAVGAGFSLFPGSVGSLDSLFGMGGGISIPVQYEIEVKGLEQFESVKEKAEEAGEAVEESRDTVSNFSSEMVRQFLKLDEEKRAALSVDMAMMPLSIMGIGGAPFRFSLPVEESKQFSETLSDIAGIAAQLGGAFMNVNENIGKAIGSAGGLAKGVSGIFKAFEGAETDGLALMGGIQGAFAGLQGLFGGEAGSDMSQLMGGLGGVGAGVAGILTGNPLEGITSLIGSFSSLIDGLTESTQEGYVKQLQKQGFNDTYSQDLLDKMSEVSDRMGDKSFGMKAYIEDFFKETNIDTAEEFGRMSDLLNESVGEYVAQGHTTDEAYEKFGDELEQLTEAQEKYGFDTVASLENMIEIQRTQTKEGRIEGLKGALGGYDKIISGLEKQMKLTPDFKLSEASISGIAGSLTNTYQELINQGMGAGEAVEAVKPLLTHYSEMAQQQGWDLSKVPGFSQLSTYFESLDKASGALDMIQGSADVVKALSGSGLMDQTTLQGQESLGLDVMHQLEASGLNETQRLQQMGGWLQAMQQASEKGGLTLSPEVQALISKAEEKGVLPEEEKPVGEVISEGIVEGFEKACGVIDNYFGKLTEYAEGGIVPGSPGGKKLVWAHAGEAIGYPAELENPAKMLEPLMEPAINGLNAMADVFKQMDDKFASGWNPMVDGHVAGSQWTQPFPFEEVKKRIEEENARNAAALKDQLPGEGQKLDISQTIENKMSLVVNSRDFVQTLKQDIYDQIKEDSKRGLLTIHDKAIKSY